MSSKTFNKEYLHSSYDDDFLRRVFESEDKDIVYRDKKNRILIKIKKD